MKTRESKSMKKRRVLLREYFLNASLIAILKKAGEQTAHLDGMTAAARKRLA